MAEVRLDSLRDAVLEAVRIARDGTQTLGRAQGRCEKLALQVLVTDALRQHGWVPLTNRAAGRLRRGHEKARTALYGMVGYEAAEHLIEALGLDEVVRHLLKQTEYERQSRARIAAYIVLKHRTFDQQIIRAAMRAAGAISTEPAGFVSGPAGSFHSHPLTHEGDFAMTITRAPRVTINGVTIVNFSSPHAFNFEDGTVLEACDETRCRHLSAVTNEVESRPEGQAWTDIELSFELGGEVRDELAALDRDLSVDVVLAPLPIVQAARAIGVGRKARTVRMADRVKKLAHTDKFCV